jgi:hypothetical protein
VCDPVVEIRLTNQRAWFEKGHVLAVCANDKFSKNGSMCDISCDVFVRVCVLSYRTDAQAGVLVREVGGTTQKNNTKQM